MTELILRLFIKDYKDTDNPEVRGKYGIVAGAVGIVCNTVLCAAKLVVGSVSGSLAITADAVNNLSDAASSVMTLLGFYIAKKPADEGHPYGHARVEYLSGLGVAALILIIGGQLARDSVGKILHPTPVEFSAALVIVLALSILVKLWMAFFGRSLGRRISSRTLSAAAADSRNDVISTGAVLAAAIAARLTGLELDGYIGLLVALFILWSGVGIAKDTIGPLLGEPADEELVRMVERETLGFSPRILGIHDLMVHDYGPGQRFATLHAEMDSREDPLAAHELLDDIERMFMEKHRIHLVTHYDPIVTDDSELNGAKKMVTDCLAGIDPRLKLHDFRMVRGRGHTNLIFDLVVPKEFSDQARQLQAKIDASLPCGETKYYTVITFDSESFNQF